MNADATPTPRGLGAWDVLLAGRNHLKTSDVVQVSDRFRDLRRSSGTLSDSFLTVEELSKVLDLAKADVQPLFDLLRASEGVHDVQDVACAFKTCDLRVLLVAMAGLTRAKVQDRMRFAALLLDEAETGFLSHDQVALVMRANTLLGVAYTGGGSTSSADFEKSDRARALVLEAPSSVSQPDAPPRISHEDFLKLVQQNPADLCIFEPPPKRAKTSSRGTPATSRSLADYSPPTSIAATPTASATQPSQLEELRSQPSQLEELRSAQVLHDLENGDEQLRNAAVAVSSESAAEPSDAIAPANNAALTPSTFTTMLQTSGGNATSSNTTTSSPMAGRSLASFAALRQTRGDRSPGGTSPSTPTRQASFSSLLRASGQQKTEDRADEHLPEAALQRSSISPVRGDRTVFTDLLRAAQGETVSSLDDILVPKLEQQREEVVTQEEAPLETQGKTEDVVDTEVALEPMQVDSVLNLSSTVSIEGLEEADQSCLRSTAIVDSTLPSEELVDIEEGATLHNSFDQPDAIVHVEVPASTSSSPPNEVGEAECPIKAPTPQVAPSVGLADSVSDNTLRLSGSAEAIEEPHSTVVSVMSPTQAQQAWSSPRGTEIESPEIDPVSDAANPATRPDTTESATSAQEIPSRSRSPRTPQQTRELVERASSVIAEAAKPLSPKEPSHPSFRAEKLAWHAMTAGDNAPTPPHAPPPEPHAPPPEPTHIAPPLLIDMPESLPQLQRAQTEVLWDTSRSLASRSLGLGTPRSRVGTPTDRPSSRVGTPRTPGRSVASVADFRRFPLAPGKSNLERQGMAPLPPETSDTPLPAPSLESQVKSPRIPATALSMRSNITPRASKDGSDATPHGTPRQSSSFIDAPQARAEKETGTPRDSAQLDQLVVPPPPLPPPPLPGQMHLIPAPPSIPSGIAQLGSSIDTLQPQCPLQPPRPANEPPPAPADASTNAASTGNDIEKESGELLRAAVNPEESPTPPLTPTPLPPRFKDDVRKVLPSLSDENPPFLSQADGTSRSQAWIDQPLSEPQVKVAAPCQEEPRKPTPRSGRSSMLATLSTRSLRGRGPGGSTVTSFLSEDKELGMQESGASSSLSARLAAMVRGKAGDSDDTSQAAVDSAREPFLPQIVPLPPEPCLPPPPHEPPREMSPRQPPLPHEPPRQSSPRQPSLPQEPPRQLVRKQPMVPRLDFTKVLRIIDGEAVSDSVLPALKAGDGQSTSSSSASSGSASDLDRSAGMGTAIADSIEADLQYIGSEAGNSSPSSKKSGTSFRTHGSRSVPLEPSKFEDEETSSVLGQPEWVNWTYNRYVYEQQRESFLALARCGPLEGRRKLVLAALVLFQVALLLFFIDIGGIGTAATATTGSSFSLSEVRVILGVFAAFAGCATLCFCANNSHSASENVDREAEESLTAGEEGLPRVNAQPRGRNYRDLLRQLKDRNQDRDARQPRLVEASGDAEIEFGREAMTTPSRLGTVSRTSNAPRSWPRQEKRRYQQLSEGEEEAKANMSLRSSFVRRSRGLFTSAQSGRGVRVNRDGLRVTPTGGIAAAAVEDLPQGWA